MEQGSHRCSVFFINTYNRDFMVANPRTAGSYPPAVFQLYITVTVYQTIAFSYSHESLLKTCKAFISVLGDEAQAADTLAGLRSAEGFIRSQLARNLNLRNTPEIRFILDESIAYGVEMSRKIDELTGGKDETD